jgi:hypothetical protein
MLTFRIRYIVVLKNFWAVQVVCIFRDNDLLIECKKNDTVY